MTEPIACDPDLPDLPQADVRSRRRPFSLVWLVPVVAALIGGWLVVKALYEKGPEITITFKAAEGLEAGKTRIKYKDVEIGQVTGITLGEGLSHVVVKAQLVKDAEHFISENTRFWVVRARVTASAIYGLGTVFSGAFIDLDPGSPGKPSRAFTGLEEPPVVTSGLSGRHFVLESERRESLEVGAPVYYRQLRVGEVVAYRLKEDGSKIEIKIFIRAPFHEFVRQNSRFWSASGVDVKMDASGIRVNTESIVSILIGGIAFDTFDHDVAPATPAPEESIFTLFKNREAAQAKIYSTKNYFVLLFEESVRGLSPGAPVEFRGIQIGQVVDIRPEFDLKVNKVKIPVIIAAEPERISAAGKLPRGVTQEALLDHLVEAGLRAQLRMGNLLTGQNYVVLDLFPNAKPAQIVRGGKYGYPEFPTTPTPLEEIGPKLTQLIAKLDKIPLEQIGVDLRDAIRGAKEFANAPELGEAIRSLNAALKELQQLTAQVRTQTAPELSATLQQAQRSLAAAESSFEPDSPQHYRLKAALDEIAGAARALRVLAEYLETHPESILRGKEAEK